MNIPKKKLIIMHLVIFKISFMFSKYKKKQKINNNTFKQE